MAEGRPSRVFNNEKDDARICDPIAQQSLLEQQINGSHISHIVVDLDMPVTRKFCSQYVSNVLQAPLPAHFINASIILRSALGTGKTHYIEKLLEFWNKGPVIYISNR